MKSIWQEDFGRVSEISTGIAFHKIGEVIAIIMTNVNNPYLMIENFSGVIKEVVNLLKCKKESIS